MWIHECRRSIPSSQSWLFSLLCLSPSITENLACRSPVPACDAACVSLFTPTLPQGLETSLGDRGSVLSGLSPSFSNPPPFPLPVPSLFYRDILISWTLSSLYNWGLSVCVALTLRRTTSKSLPRHGPLPIGVFPVGGAAGILQCREGRREGPPPPTSSSACHPPPR